MTDTTAGDGESRAPSTRARLSWAQILTHTRLRHRHHRLSPVRRRVDHPRGDRRSLGDHQDYHPPGLADPRSPKGPGPPGRVPTHGLIAPGIPVHFPSRHSPFVPFPHSHTTMVRHPGPIRGKWASLVSLTGGISACRTAKPEDCIRNTVVGTLPLSQKGLLKFLFSNLEIFDRRGFTKNPLLPMGFRTMLLIHALSGERATALPNIRALFPGRPSACAPAARHS